jgi:hypothetical protein
MASGGDYPPDVVIPAVGVMTFGGSLEANLALCLRSSTATRRAYASTPNPEFSEFLGAFGALLIEKFVVSVKE